MAGGGNPPGMTSQTANGTHHWWAACQRPGSPCRTWRHRLRKRVRVFKHCNSNFAAVNVPYVFAMRLDNACGFAGVGVFGTVCNQWEVCVGTRCRHTVRRYPPPCKPCGVTPSPPHTHPPIHTHTCTNAHVLPFTTPTARRPPHPPAVTASAAALAASTPVLAAAAASFTAATGEVLDLDSALASAAFWPRGCVCVFVCVGGGGLFLSFLGGQLETQGGKAASSGEGGMRRRGRTCVTRGVMRAVKPIPARHPPYLPTARPPPLHPPPCCPPHPPWARTDRTAPAPSASLPPPPSAPPLLPSARNHSPGTPDAFTCCPLTPLLSSCSQCSNHARPFPNVSTMLPPFPMFQPCSRPPPPTPTLMSRSLGLSRQILALSAVA